MTVMTGCKNETSAVMKGLSIENNIAYDYVLSSSLSTAKGFASELGVSAAGSANTEEGVLSASAAILVDITKGEESASEALPGKHNEGVNRNGCTREC